MDSRKILLIGATNIGYKPHGGEEYKNQLLRAYLAKRSNLITIDTLHWKYNPIIIIKLIYYIIFTEFDFIIISASSLSTYRLIKFIHYFKPKLVSKIIYSVIGGYFPEGIRNGFYKKKYYQKIKFILVEGKTLKNILAESGLERNVMIVPNYKPVDDIWQPVLSTSCDSFKFVFISSICKEKGVDIIFEAIRLLNIEKKTPKFSIDFFGPIEKHYKTEFEVKIKLHSNNCKYLGYLDIMGNREESYKKLSEYTAMLFPTIYKGEGFPGVIIDAYIAGIPVIASNWHMNNEVVINEETGLLISPRNVSDLTEAMTWIMNNPKKVHTMKLNSHKKALDYDVNKVLDTYLRPIILN